MPSRLRVFPNRRLIDHRRLALAMRKAGVMRPGSIWRRAPGLVLLAVVCMPAPTWAGDYTLAWRDGAWAERRAEPPEYARLRFWGVPARIAGQADDSPAYEPPSVTVNGVALSPFADMHRIEEVRVLQLQAETLHVFRVWRGGAGQNYQLMLVRLADEGVEVIGPLQEEFDDIEIIPTRIALDDSGKDWPGYLFKPYIEDVHDGEPVTIAVYRYLEGGYMSRLSGPAWGEWHENYTATREARIAEAIAAALTYDGLDPMAREILAGVIKSDGDIYGVLEARYPHDDPGTDRIRLTIGRHIDRDDYRGWGAVWLVEIRLWQPHPPGSPYVIESVTLSGLAG